MKATHLLLSIVMGVQLASAYDIETRDGRAYKEIRLREKTDVGIRIAHAEGEVFLDYSVIPVPDLWTFGYEKEKYDAAKSRSGLTRPAGTTRLYRQPESGRKPLSSSTPIRSIRHEGNPFTSSSQVDSSNVLSTTGGSSYTTTRTGSSNSGVSRQCVAYTQKGYRCKRMVRGGSYCYQHD